MSLLFQQLSRERESSFFFSSSSPFQTNVEKTEGDAPPCHLQRTPICPLFQVGFCSHWNGVYLMDMKDHLAHGPFGKLTYWSSCGTRQRHFLFFPCMRGMCCCTERERQTDLDNLGGFFIFYSNFPRGVPVISYWPPFRLCVVVDVFGHNEMRSGWMGSEVMLGQMFVHGDVV